MIIKNSYSAFIAIIFALTLLTGYSYIKAEPWSAPPSAPPLNNTTAPINVGSSTQGKLNGNLHAVNMVATDKMRSDLYCDSLGQNCFSPADVGSGNVTNNYNIESFKKGTFVTTGKSYPTPDSACSTTNSLTGACSCPSSSLPLENGPRELRCTGYMSGDNNGQCNSNSWFQKYQCWQATQPFVSKGSYQEIHALVRDNGNSQINSVNAIVSGETERQAVCDLLLDGSYPAAYTEVRESGRYFSNYEGANLATGAALVDEKWITVGYADYLDTITCAKP